METDRSGTKVSSFSQRKKKREVSLPSSNLVSFVPAWPRWVVFSWVGLGGNGFPMMLHIWFPPQRKRRSNLASSRLDKESILTQKASISHLNPG